MSLSLFSLKSAAAWALMAAVVLSAGSRLVAAEVNQKCAAHAAEWNRLQADKKWSLEHFKGDKEQLAYHQKYYAEKEALLLRKMLLCPHCQGKQGTVADFPSGGGSGSGPRFANGVDPTRPADPAQAAHLARGEQFAKMSTNAVFPRHVSIVAQPGERVIERISNELNFDPKAYQTIWESVNRGFQDATTEWVFLVNDQGMVTRSWDRKRYEAEAKVRK